MPVVLFCLFCFYHCDLGYDILLRKRQKCCSVYVGIVFWKSKVSFFFMEAWMYFCSVYIFWCFNIHAIVFLFKHFLKINIINQCKNISKSNLYNCFIETKCTETNYFVNFFYILKILLIQGSTLDFQCSNVVNWQLTAHMYIRNQVLLLS